MIRTMLTILVSVGLTATPAMARAARTSATEAETATVTEAATAEGASDPRVYRLQTMYAEAQSRVQRYNETRQLEDLQVARELLATWLAEHRVLYGDTQAALAVRAPVQQQLETVDAQIAAIVAPPPRVVAPSAPVADAAPRDPAEDVGRGLIHGGTALLVVGGSAVLGVGVPLLATRDRALDRAATREFRVEQQADLDRARRRHAGAITMFAVGGSLAVVGISMLAVGGAKRAQARRRLSVAPLLGPGFAGASATLRF